MFIDATDSIAVGVAGIVAVPMAKKRCGNGTPSHTSAAHHVVLYGKAIPECLSCVVQLIPTEHLGKGRLTICEQAE
jgi:hypothetical protein